MLRMGWLASDQTRRLLGLVVLATLVGLSAAAAHQATYLFDALTGSEPASAASTHDGRWAPLIAVCVVSAVLLLAIAARQVRRLATHPQHVHLSGATEGFMGQILGLWLRVGTSTAVVYAAQEYLERSVTGPTPATPELLLAHGPVPILAIALSSLLVATVAALVRWHCRLIAANRRAALERPASDASRPLCPTWDVRPVGQPGVRALGIRAPPPPLSA